MRRLHRARWVVADADTVINHGHLVVENGTIVSVGTGKGPKGVEVEEHGDTALVPAFVNAHTHLELSALSGRVNGTDGFAPWVRDLLAVRESIPRDELVLAAQRAVTEAEASGTLLFGEISTLGITRPLFENKGTKGIWFQELLGSPEPLSMPAGSKDAPWVSLAAHAPHTTAPGAIKAMKALAAEAGRPFSIHLDESDAEREFLTTGKGPWAEFLTERGIDYSSWPLPADDPVSYLLDLGVVDSSTLVVHLLQAGVPQLRRLADAGATAVCCIRSNRLLHGRVPDIEAMVGAGLTVALGTDSLASCESLSILDEMRAVATCAPGLSPAEIFRMATENGARALGFSERFGRLVPGCSARCLEVTPTSSVRSFSYGWFFDEGLAVRALQ
ncbi:amidohydrolase family protein [Desulfoluna spongiiphila]|uniref:Cytosine/adenosine deaminase n=1 Tax=Desulfoluna spongiiphila TaxID=419481 RepID=A0A1G5HSU2_9BACT|nr:amidohydrolase family protein [Desulfoluna spongiiphila]SCY66350.1 Cytosine/adenosine deaminase [Desulfoluna spongiiphila]